MTDAQKDAIVKAAQRVANQPSACNAQTVYMVGVDRAAFNELLAAVRAAEHEQRWTVGQDSHGCFCLKRFGEHVGVIGCLAYATHIARLLNEDDARGPQQTGRAFVHYQMEFTK